MPNPCLGFPPSGRSHSTRVPGDGRGAGVAFMVVETEAASFHGNGERQ